MYPRIHAPNRETAQQFSLDLFYSENADEQLPVITFQSESKRVVHPTDVGLSGGELVKQAFRNLAQREVNLTEHPAGDGVLLVAENQPLAAEKILDKEFLRSVGERLGSERLLVGIPAGDYLFIARQDHAVSAELLHRRVGQLFLDYAQRPISRFLFLINDGVIVGTEAGKFSTASYASAHPEGYEGSTTRINLFGARYQLKIMGAAEDIGTFLNGLLGAVVDGIRDHIGNRDFDGTLELQSAIQQPGNDRTIRRRVDAFLHELPDHPRVRAALRSSSRTLRVSYLAGEDFQRGDLHKKTTIHLNKQN